MNKDKISIANEIIRCIDCNPYDVAKIAKNYNLKMRICTQQKNKLYYRELFKHVKQINSRELITWTENV